MVPRVGRRAGRRWGEDPPVDLVGLYNTVRMRVIPARRCHRSPSRSRGVTPTVLARVTTVGIVAPKHESPWLDPQIARYVAERAAPPDEILRDLITETAEATGDRAPMQIAADQGALMAMLTSLVGARTAIEVGTFTGYSSICIARALPPDGRLLCCDVSDTWTSIARRAWARAGLTDRIELRLGPAVETLAALDDTEFATIDIAFIDADKPSYLAYYEALLARLRPNGLICIDNTLWSGRVVDPSVVDDDTTAMRRLNDHVASDERVESYILPIADGLTLVRKR